ncbi:hypothetical protein GEMRC1_001222 [Eukaryota sp. GEM-RC1]
MTSTQIAPASLCIKLLETSLKHDFSVSFNDLQIPCHSVVLVQFSEFFHNLFTLNLSDDQESQDFSSLNVSASSFRSFFSYLYAQPVEITLENLYEFYVLSRYFMVEDLKTTCLELLTHFSNSTDSLLFLVKQANECQDQEFLKHLLPFFKSDFETIPESFPLCFEYLSLFGQEFGFKNQIIWLLNCLVKSIDTQQLDDEQFDSFLNTLKVDNLTGHELFQYLIQPVIDNSIFEASIVKISMKYFSNNFSISNIPLNWIIKVLEILNREDSSEVFEIVPHISQFQDFSHQELLSLNPKVLLEMIKKSANNRNFSIFCLQNLIESWSSGKGSSWQSNDVKDCLESVNLSLLTGSEIQSLILSPLGDDDQLVSIISKITNKVIVPNLVDNFELQKEELKNENEKLKSENDLLLSKNNELEADVLSLNNEVHTLRAFKQKVEEEENERRRIEALIGTFVSTTCGSRLSLSNSNTVVKRNGSDGKTNSFVKVNLSDNSSVKFTRLDDLSDDINDFIGWKNRGTLTDDFTPNPCVSPRGNCALGYFSSNPKFPQITRGESITVSFSSGKAYFKPSTCTTTFSTDMPRNLVFGITVNGQNHEWKVERV